MSYILDALKKLEHEKTRKNRGSGVVNIAGELFESDQPRPAGKATWKIACVVLVAVFVTFVLTWKMLPSGKQLPGVTIQKSQPVAPPIAAAPPKVEAIPQPPVSFVPSPLPQNKQQVQSVKTIQPARSSDPKLQRPVSIPVVQAAKQPATSPTMTAAEDDAAALLTQQELRRRLKERKSTPSLPSMAPPADIKLSGIAYQDERRARRAVVNGFLVQEGATISGSVVTDIFQDRVRFTQGGRSFELSLVSAGNTVPGRLP